MTISISTNPEVNIPRRKRELRGSGIIIGKRESVNGMLRTSSKPFEHKQLADAMKHAHELSLKHPGVKFEIMVHQCAFKDGKIVERQ